MSFRTPILGLAAALALTTACTNKKVNNPLAKIDSKQPDVVLFDRGMDAMKHNHFDIARLDMQTLINTYPDSEYIARAKLALADSWYAEGGTAGLAQAKQEYEDFKTFFPNMPEAAEAQLKIANIEFSQMEKPDRDFTHAVNAEREYRAVIEGYPDNQKMVAEARIKLLQVQEVIADREFRVGRFYYLRESYPAAIARLRSLADRYPLYSKADETLYLLGQTYEAEIASIKKQGVIDKQQMEKSGKLNAPDSNEFKEFKKREAARENMTADFMSQASAAYKMILTRYPVMDRSDDAKARLIALHQDVPRPTKAMLAQNKAEEAARHEDTLRGDLMGMFSKKPQVNEATTVGEPTLQETQTYSATDIVQEATIAAEKGNKPKGALSIEETGTGPPPENQAAPRSDDPAASASVNANTGDQNAASSSTAQNTPDPNELKPNTADTSVAADNDPNELKPIASAGDTPAPAPQQVNEINQTNGNTTAQAPANGSASSGQELADDQMIASSKHKKKKGLAKIIPGK